MRAREDREKKMVDGSLVCDFECVCFLCCVVFVCVCVRGRASFVIRGSGLLNRQTDRQADKQPSNDNVVAAMCRAAHIVTVMPVTHHVMSLLWPHYATTGSHSPLSLLFGQTSRLELG